MPSLRRPAGALCLLAWLASTSLAAPVHQTAGTGDITPPTHLSTETAQAQNPQTPWLVRWMLHPMPRGMLVSLPIIATDPNRGITFGVLPIAVIKESTSSQRIEQIHAPSLSYNRYFLWIPTYRYYYYPAADKSFIARGSLSKYEHEMMGEYDDKSFLSMPVDSIARIQYNIDAGARFYGFGPASTLNGQSNYRADYVLYTGTFGHVIVPDTPLRAHFTDRLLSERIANGPIPGLQSFDSLYGALAPIHYQQTNELRLTLDYDTRNHPVTTGRGDLLQAFYELSSRDFASEYDYTRYGLDAREFHPWQSNERLVSAAQFRYEQLLGQAPFWLEPSLGGKYSLRAYGEGRFVDRGMFAVNFEERYTFNKQRLAGVMTSFEIAPFTGLGEVFDNPGAAQRKYLRPVFGAAIRAVARPQVVGSVDFGIGQEGLAVFTDINYSF